MSCTPVLSLLYGVKKPRVESNESVMAFVRSHNLDYDYVIRPKNDSSFIPVIKAVSQSMNGIRVFASNGDLLIDTNDSSCHMTVRGDLTKAIKSGRVPHAVAMKTNIKSLVQSETVCLSCSDGQPLFSHRLKRYVVVFGVAKFIPIRKHVTDIDYVQELRKAGLRDSVTVVLLNTDRLQ